MKGFPSFKRDSLVWNSGLIALVQGLSGLLNLLTQIILARHIGMGGVSDGFFVAYVVPDTVAGIFLSLALLVLLPRVVDDHGITAQGRALCWTFAGLAAGILLVGSLLVLSFSAPVIALLGPGLSVKGAAVAVETLRIMAFVMLFQGVAGVAVATLQAAGRFAVAAVGRVIFALAPFVAAIFWLEEFGIAGVAWAALGGSMLACLYLLLVMGSVVGLAKPAELAAAWPQAMLVTRGLVPVLLARAMAEGWGFLVRAVATGTLAGGATLLVLSQRFGNILLMIGNSFGTVAYPELARKSKSDLEGLITLVRLRCEQCFLFLSVLAWPMAGIADDLLRFTAKGEHALENPALLRTGAVALALFCLMAPLASVNSMIGNISWACGRVWNRLGLEAATLVFLTPVLWFSAKQWGLLAIPEVTFAAWIMLLVAGEFMLRSFFNRPFLLRATLGRWLLIAVLSAAGGLTSGWVSAWIHSGPRSPQAFAQLLGIGVSYAAGLVVSAGLVYWFVGLPARKEAAV